VTSYRAVDVMGFAGGFTLGMVQAGFHLAGKRELNGGFGVANCLANRHLLGNDWHVEVGDATRWTVPSDGVDVVFGNPPCSGFSVMSAKSFRGADSSINHCMWAFADYVIRARPTVAVFESVQQAVNSTDGHALMRRLREHVEEHTNEKWTLHHVRHNAYSVGGPAQRRRYFWLISRIPFGIEEPRPRTVPLLRDVIGDLANLGLSWHPQPYQAPAHPWTEHLRSPSGTVDGHIGLSGVVIQRIEELLRSVYWGPGEHIAVPVQRHFTLHGYLPPRMAHLTDKLVSRNFQMGFTTPTRWDGNKAARVVTGGGLQMIIHPWLNRLITHREAARILGFPDDWQILPLRGVSGLQLTWGKGISVACGRWIGTWISRALSGEPGSFAGVPVGDREFNIDVTNAWKHATVPEHAVDCCGTVKYA